MSKKKKKSAQGPSALDLFSRVIESFEIGGIFGADVHRGFGLPPNDITVRHENARQYQLNVRALYRSVDDIRLTCSLASFEKQLAKIAIEILRDEREPNESDVKKLLEGMVQEAAQKCAVVCPIYGVRLSGSPVPLELGPFTLYSRNMHSDQLKNLIPAISEKDFESSEYFIKVNVITRDGDKARELADELFRRFESLARFMIGYPTSRLNVAILSGGHSSRRLHIVVDESGRSTVANAWNKVTNPLDIDNDFFFSDDQGFKRLWNLLNFQEPSSALEQRLLLAADWVGQSFGESSPSNAFLKAAIALEILFSRQVNSLVTPSILSQISESVALMLAGDVENRLALDKEMRRLYGMRSSIAHGGKQDVHDEDVGTIQQIARNVIVSLFTSRRLDALKDVDDLAEFIRSLKYSGGTFELTSDSSNASRQ